MDSYRQSTYTYYCFSNRALTKLREFWRCLIWTFYVFKVRSVPELEYTNWKLLSCNMVWCFSAPPQNKLTNESLMSQKGICMWACRGWLEEPHSLSDYTAADTSRSFCRQQYFRHCKKNTLKYLLVLKGFTDHVSMSVLKVFQHPGWIFTVTVFEFNCWTSFALCPVLRLLHRLLQRSVLALVDLPAARWVFGSNRSIILQSQMEMSAVDWPVFSPFHRSPAVLQGLR